MDLPVTPPARSVFFGIAELEALRALRRPGVSVVVTSPVSTFEETVVIRREGSNEVFQVHKECSEAAFVVTSWQEVGEVRYLHRIRVVSPSLDRVVRNLQLHLIGEPHRRG